MSLVFASSPYVNADHVLQTYNRNPNRENSLDIHLEATKGALIKFCILYLPESNVNLNLDAAWNADPELCASLCFALQSPRFIGTPVAFSKRGAILQWFPTRLAQLQNLNNVPSAVSHDVYMHCSYDIAPNKHDVKKH
ncbi:O-linked N-acetylglucosaminetransferase [Actinobacillus equuli]|nr:O-linked N-acetylglucosaminetransferase [Actinobacillus equuli]